MRAIASPENDYFFGMGGHFFSRPSDFFGVFPYMCSRRCRTAAVAVAVSVCRLTFAVLLLLFGICSATAAVTINQNIVYIINNYIYWFSFYPPV